jgi:hypothetical protein
LRERVAKLGSGSATARYDYDPRLWSEEGVEALRKKLRAFRYPKRAADEYIEGSLQIFRRGWAKGYECYRDMLRNPQYWRGTIDYEFVFPPNGEPLPDGPRPKPVYMKPNSDILFSLEDGFVNLWVKAPT